MTEITRLLKKQTIAFKMYETASTLKNKTVVSEWKVPEKK